MKFARSLLALTALTLVVPACAGSADTDAPAKKKKKGGEDTVPMSGAHGVVVTQVAMYQGVKRTLSANGGPVPSEVPIIPGRDALVRVFFSADANYNGLPIQAELHIDGFDPIIQEVPVLMGSSVEGDLATTVNFIVPGAQIGPTFTYQVKLNQPDVDGGNPSAHYPIGAFEPVAAGAQNTLRIIMAPLAYNYDGSGRVPNLSPEVVERYRQKFMQTYPVSNVELYVRDVVGYNGYVDPTPSGNDQSWNNIMYRVFQMRDQDGASPDIYYYGVFDPAPSFYSFCGQGCVLGTTWLNSPEVAKGDPAGTVDFRFSVGVGFLDEDIAFGTSIHEIGHAHGREHVNCGYGLDPYSIDQGYPYNPRQVGSWGWDMFTNTLVDPTNHTDFMGYCEDNWISDYTYIGLYNRGALVNAPKKIVKPLASLERVEYEVVAVAGDGSAQFLEPTTPRERLGGEQVTVSAFDEDGNVTPVSATVARMDHVPGSVLFLPKTNLFNAGKLARIEAVLDDQFVVARRLH